MVIVNDHYQSTGIVCLSGGVQCVARKWSISFICAVDRQTESIPFYQDLNKESQQMYRSVVYQISFPFTLHQCAVF